MELKELVERLLELDKNVINTTVYILAGEPDFFRYAETNSLREYYEELVYLHKRISRELIKILDINVLGYSYDDEEIEQDIRSIESYYNYVMNNYLHKEN